MRYDQITQLQADFNTKRLQGELFGQTLYFTSRLLR